MTAAELIAELQKLPADMPVVTPGFDEDGYDHLRRVQPVRVVKVNEEATFSGELVLAEDAELYDRTPLAEPFDAIMVNW